MWTTCGVCVLNFRRIVVSGWRISCPLQWGFVIEVEANLISTPVSIDAITVLLWYASSATWLLSTENPCSEDLAFPPICWIGCVIGSREEHLCLVYVMCLVHQISFLKWATCDIGVFWCKSIRFWFLNWTYLIPWFVVWFGFGLGIHQTLVSEVDPLFMVDFVWDPSEFDFWCGSRWCRRQNLLLLIRFQHEGVCEAWTPGSWLPWWTI